ncbi:LysR family transcriptional regulator [Tropicimonas isoalkanivorans]|uniref:DNA-binding transcriptional regulator, LysR family n=1 Tax=Tropicimonas isoalkanivorans TaxID=441112 RepID=A0A1I1H964_9RHOB|nr:LysR family transcriptional regulator [Tropicimonas isoalkanivorans]SFC20699.1 DNA-binding transcriptional regulator, LysR family [Tropicimonas isoalkanivorans]
MLTLRQIEVIRAITMAGTVKGAAELLGVSAPGISRLMKHTEAQLGIRLFSRTHGRYAPTDEARDIFAQVSAVFQSVENLQTSIEALKSGGGRVAAFAAVPSIAHHVFPAAVTRLRRRFPDLRLSLNTIKIEEAIDYLLLRRGEVAALSYKLDHPGLLMQPLYSGRLMAIFPAGHRFAEKEMVSLQSLVSERLIGVGRDDPYGRILHEPFRQNGLDVDYAIMARTGEMISALVGQGMGVAVMDELSLAGPARQPGIEVRPIAEPTVFRTYAALKADEPRSIFAEAMIEMLRAEMNLVAATRSSG